MSATSDNTLTLSIEQEGTAAVVRINGSVTIDEADKLTKQMESLTAAQTPIIVLDLSQMDFICSSGLGAIILGHLRSRHHAGQVHLACPQPAVRTLLETTRLTKLFTLYDSVAEALKS